MDISDNLRHLAERLKGLGPDALLDVKLCQDAAAIIDDHFAGRTVQKVFQTRQLVEVAARIFAARIANCSPEELQYPSKHLNQAISLADSLIREIASRRSLGEDS